jgi:hypothetical protein
VDWDELERWGMIDKALNLGCPDPAETYSSSPHIYEELGIPTDATGTVGSPRRSAAKRGDKGEKADKSEKRISSADSTSERPARTRTRRRTRAGKPATGHPEGVTTAAETAEADAPVAESDNGDAPAAARRRRRRRPRKTEAASAG